VYVYDSDGSAFDFHCQGWIWSQMGFLDENGQPAVGGQNTPPNPGGDKKGDQLKIGSGVAGTVLGDDGKGHPNAYAKTDGSAEAYDLSHGATLKDAYARLKQGGKLVICKHGGEYSVTVNGEAKFFQGGIIHLDGGGTFTGFAKQGEKSAKGTNVNQPDQRKVGDPYQLPAPPSGVTVKAVLYGCYGARVPNDGKNGERSVQKSLEDVLGKGNVTAWTNVVDALVKVDWSTSAETQEKADELAKKAETALNDAARKAGRDDVNEWLNKLPFLDQYSTLQKVIDDDPTLKGRVKLKLTYPEPHDPPTAIGPESECPVMVVGGGTTLKYGSPGAQLNLPSNALPAPQDMILVGVDATSLPPGPGVLESDVVRVASARDGSPELRTRLKRPAILILPVLENGGVPRIFRLHNEVWSRVSGRQLRNRARRTISVSIRQLGTFSVFDIGATGEPTPTPPGTPSPTATVADTPTVTLAATPTATPTPAPISMPTHTPTPTQAPTLVASDYDATYFVFGTGSPWYYNPDLILRNAYWDRKIVSLVCQTIPTRGGPPEDTEPTGWSITTRPYGYDARTATTADAIFAGVHFITQLESASSPPAQPPSGPIDCAAYGSTGSSLGTIEYRQVPKPTR
jgi:hypothetical protein